MISVRLQTAPLDELKQKAAGLTREGDVAEVGARAVANLVRDHLFNLDNSAANQMSGKRTHFYAAAAKSVHEPKQEGNSASFVITKTGLAQRWLGGTIRAGAGISSATGGPTKYLAVPANNEAYGKAPGEFGKLDFIPRGNGKAMLVKRLAAVATNIEPKKRGSGYKASSVELGSLVMFWLVTEVHQEANPDVMPSETDMVQEAQLHMGNYLTRLLESRGGTN
jgi:hypothetical protein